MPDQITYTPDQHAQHMEERKLLIDASRESSRTFDKAMLTFGSAIFGFSVAFIKDVAPQPIPATLHWLGASWILFTVGLLAISLSFLFSQWACDFQISQSENILKNPEYRCPTNKWSIATMVCNISCVGLLFLGIMCWSWFAIHNLGQRENIMSKSDGRSREQTGYIPPPPPARVPPLPLAPPPPPPPPEK
jgi:hypothetical protein